MSNQGSSRGYYNGQPSYMPTYQMQRDDNYQPRPRTVSENLDMQPNGYVRQGGPMGRPRPLARLVARSRNFRGRGPLRRGECEAYRMEVNEIYIDQDNEAKGPIPCITVLDFKRIVPTEVSQRRVCIPVALSDTIVKYIKGCKVTVPSQKVTVEEEKQEEITEEEVKEGEESGTVPTIIATGPTKYDVSLLDPKTFKCPKTGQVVIVENVIVNDVVQKHLRSFMNVPEQNAYTEGDPVETIELRSDLLRSLDRFLSDVAVRYRNIKSDVSIPSLYSYSGERRFYYDLRKTRWGLRLHISQVTDMHRNVIGIPLEALVSFRDRLDQAISTLRLDDDAAAGGTGYRRGTANPRRRRRNMGYRGGSSKTKKQNAKNTSGSDKGGALTSADTGGEDSAGHEVKEEKVIVNATLPEPVEAN